VVADVTSDAVRHPDAALAEQVKHGMAGVVACDALDLIGNEGLSALLNNVG
jgi:hypothetical protein